jgi:hypothetical protein
MDVQNRVNKETKRGSAALPWIIAYPAAGATYKMQPTDNVVIADTILAAGVDAACILYLPSVAAAVGQFYFVSAPKGATGGDLSLYLAETNAEWTTQGDLDADDDHVLVYSDGINWRVVKNGVA